MNSTQQGAIVATKNDNTTKKSKAHSKTAVGFGVLAPVGGLILTPQFVFGAVIGAWIAHEFLPKYASKRTKNRASQEQTPKSVAINATSADQECYCSAGDEVGCEKMTWGAWIVKKVFRM